ncbi:MAG: DUF1275 domain-containing protein [Flavobacteriia bacterium]|nr:DUF1275 domain-containing protein [Flavobacteriia bacterium]OJX35331.1 MAG: DUF1275 family protein [Flavobacteriia bacterium 40-80]
MLRKFNNQRSLKDNLQLGAFTAITAGAVNVTSLILFFAFTSNVTGHYAIFAFELINGNFFRALVVFGWIFLFFIGSFLSNLIIINLSQKNTYLAHALPLVLEIICILSVGFYGDNFYNNTLKETEILIGLLLLSMGLQNGLTASISNFQIKTTHLTGATTDLGILFALFTKREQFATPEIVAKAKLLIVIFCAYIFGAIAAGFLYQMVQFKTFYFICITLFFIIFYDLRKISKNRIHQRARKYIKGK